MPYLSFEPVYQKRVWGGRGLATYLGRELPPDSLVGESWDIVDRSDCVSVVTTGPYAGYTLRQLLERYPDWLMGGSWDSSQRFPILVKWLDCCARLSLQVHPPPQLATELKGESKDECWYIANAAPGAALYLGLKKGVSRADFERAIHDECAESCCNRLPVTAGESVFVESGCIHAIDSGNFILEIQQNSDTTFRVYDWGRLGLDGKPRELHIDASLQSINFEDEPPQVVRPLRGEQLLAECSAFRLRKIDMWTWDPLLRFHAGEQPRILSIVEGQILADASGSLLGPGANLLIPYAEDFSGRAVGSAKVLVTDRFC